MKLIKTVLRKISNQITIESYNSSDQSIYIKKSIKRLFRVDLIELIISINRNESIDIIRLEAKYNNNNEIIMISKGKFERILIENDILDENLKFILNQLYGNKKIEMIEFETIIDSLVEIEFVDGNELKTLNIAHSTDMLAQELAFYIDLFSYEIAIEFNNYILSNKIKIGFDILGICNEIDSTKFNLKNLIKPPSSYFWDENLVENLYRQCKVNGRNVLGSFNPYLMAVIYNDLHFKLRFDPRIQELINTNKIQKESIDEIFYIIRNNIGDWYTPIFYHVFLAYENNFIDKTENIVDWYNKYLGFYEVEIIMNYINALNNHFENIVSTLLNYLSKK